MFLYRFGKLFYVQNDVERQDPYGDYNPGKAGSRDFCLNGPAARLGKVGDVVTIMAFSAVEEERLAVFRPTVIVLDENNEIKHRHN